MPRSCESCIVPRARPPGSTRGPSHAHVNPRMRAWAAPPTCMSRGLRAYQGVYVHTQGFTCERAMWLSGRYHPGQAPDNVRPDMLATTLARRPTMCSSNPYPRELPKTQDTSPLAARFQCFSPRWSVFWAPRPSGRPLDGGNCTTRGFDTPATRRKRASCSAKPPSPPT